MYFERGWDRLILSHRLFLWVACSPNLLWTPSWRERDWDHISLMITSLIFSLQWNNVYAGRHLLHISEK